MEEFLRLLTDFRLDIEKKKSTQMTHAKTPKRFSVRLEKIIHIVRLAVEFALAPFLRRPAASKGREIIISREVKYGLKSLILQ